MTLENFYKDLQDKKKSIAVVGLGYVGIPILTHLGRHFKTIGFDISKDKLEDIKNKNNLEDFPELEEIGNIDCTLSSDEKVLKNASFFIITVPTPVDKHNDPDLTALISATEIVGKNMPEDSIVVYESTVYPGLIEEVCVPVLEKQSGYRGGVDFHVGYSPERINPGDKTHTLENIVKVVSAQDEASLDIVDKVYSKIIKAGTYRAESIRVAEAAKVIENIQRDLNIALVNELAMIFLKMGIDSNQVFNAAKTKWNFLDFKPGLVGGHCIGVDPFYLTYKAMEIGYHPEIILAGRRINDNMSYFIGNEILKNLLANSEVNGKLKIALFGITFKENIKDIRNSKVVDLYKYLKQYGASVQVHDPVADKEQVYKEYGIEIVEYRDINNMDAAVFCVAHDNFKQIELPALKSKFRNEHPYIFDVKGIFDKKALESAGFKYWRL
ncbi:MAG: nucleotide sugar dehydrogenase [Actinomycetota bacterium]|nr:nucleotide sugar dehydrogenase [Actinomycetota bacterium]